MEFVAYPKWKYHPDKEAIVVGSKEAEAALGHGWHDSPAHFPAKDGGSVATEGESLSERAQAKKPRRSKS